MPDSSSPPIRRVLLAALLLGCAAPRPDLGKTEPQEEHGDGFALILNNRHYLDVNVFVQHDGQASRVGTVTGSSSLAVDVPAWMLGQSKVVRLIAEPIGDESRYVTDNLTVVPGQVIELNLESSIGRSNYSIQ